MTLEQQSIARAERQATAIGGSFMVMLSYLVVGGSARRGGGQDADEALICARCDWKRQGDWMQLQRSTMLLRNLLPTTN